MTARSLLRPAAALLASGALAASLAGVALASNGITPLVTPGTYYWQAYRIDCTTNLSDCKKESKVTRFKVG